MTPATQPYAARFSCVRTCACAYTNAYAAVQLLCALSAPTMQAGIHFGVAIRAIHYPVSVGCTIRSRFSRRNNADISTLASPSLVRGWPGAGAEVVSRCQRQYFPSTGVRVIHRYFFPWFPSSLSLSLSLVDAVGEITHFENACQPVRLSIAATSGIHDNV